MFEWHSWKQYSWQSIDGAGWGSYGYYGCSVRAWTGIYTTIVFAKKLAIFWMRSFTCSTLLLWESKKITPPTTPQFTSSFSAKAITTNFKQWGLGTQTQSMQSLLQFIHMVARIISIIISVLSFCPCGWSLSLYSISYPGGRTLAVIEYLWHQRGLLDFTFLWCICSLTFLMM